jgi:predicted nucleic acid-binding protein
VILVDTAVWVDHLRSGNRRLEELLDAGQVAIHPFVIGELACGNLRHRGQLLEYLGRLPALPVASHDEAMRFLEAHDLAGTGLGWIDVHLLASVLIGSASLWTLDGALSGAARRMGVAN